MSKTCSGICSIFLRSESETKLLNRATGLHYIVSIKIAHMLRETAVKVRASRHEIIQLLLENLNCTAAIQ